MSDSQRLFQIGALVSQLYIDLEIKIALSTNLPGNTELMPHILQHLLQKAWGYFLKAGHFRYVLATL